MPAVPGHASGLDAIWSAGAYEGVARRLVAGLKFGRRLRLAEVAAATIVRSVPPEFLVGTVVPVPPSPLRARWRGFDVAHAMATQLAQDAGLPREACLRRTNGRRQVGRSRSARLSDPPHVFTTATAPLSVLLVDDVLTTGATLVACAAALRAAGSTRVAAVTLASSVDRRVPPTSAR